jgi:hypothetical protein
MTTSLQHFGFENNKNITTKIINYWRKYAIAATLIVKIS